MACLIAIRRPSGVRQTPTPRSSSQCYSGRRSWPGRQLLEGGRACPPPNENPPGSVISHGLDTTPREPCSLSPVASAGRNPINPLYSLLCVAALTACESNAFAPNGSITSALKPGMTEQQVAEISNNRVPDRVVVVTCGPKHPGRLPARFSFTRECSGPAVRCKAFRRFGGRWRAVESKPVALTAFAVAWRQTSNYGSREGDFPMRKLSVVAILLAISAACSRQPAANRPPPAGTNSGRPNGSCKSIGFYHEARVRAVVARSDPGNVIRRVCQLFGQPVPIGDVNGQGLCACRIPVGSLQRSTVSRCRSRRRAPARLSTAENDLVSPIKLE